MHGKKISALPVVTQPAEAPDPELGCPTWSPLAHILTFRAVRSGCCVRLWEAGPMVVGGADGGRTAFLLVSTVLK